jgi:hypothetical protein
MKTKLLACTMLAAAVAMSAGTALAQQPKPEIVQAAADPVKPKTAWGAPDLQGFWTNVSVTSLQRPGNLKSLVLTEEEAAKAVNRNILTILSKDDQSTNGQDPNNTKLLEDKNNDRGYNAFWIDPGTRMALVKGEYRSSWIVEPANGRIPYKNAAARAGGGYAITNFDGPETRPLAERCLMSFSGSAGPVMQNGMYNNTYQLVQSPNSVMILVEMNHEARIIPIVASKADVKHSPIPKWAGDSVGWYEGDTLVVETTNVNPEQRALIGPNGKVTERFSRWNKDQILYEFTVEDPDLYSQPWKGEMGLNHSSEPLYEYACHEGNYALHGILAGARELESKGITPGMGPGIAAGLVIPRDGEGGGE